MTSPTFLHISHSNEKSPDITLAFCVKASGISGVYSFTSQPVSKSSINKMGITLFKHISPIQNWTLKHLKAKAYRQQSCLFVKAPQQLYHRKVREYKPRILPPEAEKAPER